MEGKRKFRAPVSSECPHVDSGSRRLCGPQYRSTRASYPQDQTRQSHSASRTASPDERLKAPTTPRRRRRRSAGEHGSGEADRPSRYVRVCDIGDDQASHQKAHIDSAQLHSSCYQARRKGNSTQSPPARCQESYRDPPEHSRQWVSQQSGSSGSPLWS